VHRARSRSTSLDALAPQRHKQAVNDADVVRIKAKSKASRVARLVAGTRCKPSPLIRASRSTGSPHRPPAESFFVPAKSGAFSAMISSLRRVPISRGWGSIMRSVNRYGFHALHCMTKAAQARFPHEKRQWLLMANTWLEMIPEDQRTAVDRLRAAIGDQSAEPSISECLLARVKRLADECAPA
jgi:hypothetical protein